MGASHFFVRHCVACFCAAVRNEVERSISPPDTLRERKIFQQKRVHAIAESQATRYANVVPPRNDHIILSLKNKNWDAPDLILCSFILN